MFKKTILAASLTLLCSSAFADDARCTNTNKFEFNQPEWGMQLYNLAKWEVNNGIECAAEDQIKNAMNDIAKQIATSLVQFGADALVGFLPFPLPVGALFGGSGPDPTALILEAIAELKITVQKQNSHMAGFLWLQDFDKFAGEHKTWIRLLSGNSDKPYLTDGQGYKKLDDLSLRIKGLVDGYRTKYIPEDESAAITVDKVFFLHFMVSATKSYVSMLKEYMTYAELSERGVNSALSSQNFLTNSNGTVNSENMNSVLAAVKERTEVEIAGVYAQVLGHITDTVVSAVKNKATSAVENLSLIQIPVYGIGPDAQYNGSTRYYIHKLTYKMGANNYDYQCRSGTNFTSGNCLNEISLTVNGISQDRMFVEKFNNMKALSEYIKLRGFDSYYTNAWANLIPTFHNWQLAFNDIWLGLSYSQKSAAGGLNAYNNATIFPLKTRHKNSGDTAYVYGVNGLNQVYYQPLESAGVSSSTMTDAGNHYFSMVASGLTSYITHVEVTVNIEHTDPKDLVIVIYKPDGSAETLRAGKDACETDHNNPDTCATGANIMQTFIVPLKGARINGKYTLVIMDTSRDGNMGIVKDWQLIFK